MPITEQQRQERKNGVGSSDVPAILGVDPWKTAYRVWGEKCGKYEDVPDEAPDKGRDPRWLGTMLEPALISMAAEDLGELKTDVEVLNPDGLPLFSHLDALRMAYMEPVEAKSSGLLYGKPQEWGEGGTDEVPTYTLMQCQTHILNCGGDKVCHVPALIGGRGYVLFVVEPNTRLMDLIAEKVLWFWEKCVKTATPPPNVTPLLDEVKKLLRVPQKKVLVDPLLINEYIQMNLAAKDAEKTRDVMKARIIAGLGDAEYGENVDGPDITYYEQERKEYVVQAGKYRVFRLKNKKGGN